VRLCEQPHYAATLAAWHAREWQHLYDPAIWNESIALTELQSERPEVAIPTTILALQGETLVGCVSLVRDDLPGYQVEGPWLASLFVRPTFRGLRIGVELVSEVMRFCAENRWSEVYLFSENRVAFFRKLGFAQRSLANACGRRVVVMAACSS
jgi:predicted N-acetyltransferase YhbS